MSQASWNPENLGQSTVQILRDPGWLLKWIGSVLICTGIFMLFYLKGFRRPSATATATTPARSLGAGIGGGARLAIQRAEEDRKKPMRIFALLSLMSLALAGCGSGRLNMEREGGARREEAGSRSRQSEGRARVELGLLQRPGGDALGSRRRDDGALERIALHRSLWCSLGRARGFAGEWRLHSARFLDPDRRAV